MQAVAEDIVDPSIAQVGIQIAGEARAFQMLGRREQAESPVDLGEAGVERARKGRVQDQQFGDPPGRDLAPVDVAVGAEGADRAEQRAPLVIVDGAAGLLAARQQDMVFHVEDAGRAVRPFDEGANPDEMEGVVLHRGADGHAAEQVRPALHPVEEGAKAPGFEPRCIEFGDGEPGLVERLPHLAADPGPFGPGVLARRPDAAVDARRIGPVERGKVQDVALARLAILRPEGGWIGADLDGGLPVEGFFRRRGRHQGHAVGHVEHPRRILGPLDITRQPVQVLGAAAQHGRSSLAIRVGRVIRPAPRCPLCRRPGRNSPPGSLRARPPG